METIKIEDVTVHHLSEPAPMKVNVKLEKMTKGYNWEITIQNAPTADAAIYEAVQADLKLGKIYNQPPAPTTAAPEKE